MRKAALAAVIATAALALPAGRASASPSSPVISGTVRDRTGLGIAATCVRANATSWSPGAHYASGTTDSTGAYELAGLDPDTYTLSFGCAGADWVSLDKRGVVLAAGQDTTGVDATLIKGGTVTGTVTDSLGQPASSLVFLTGEKNLFQGSTDSSGVYRIHGVPPGAYRVTPDYTRTGNDWNGGSKLVVASGRTYDHVDGVVPATGAITGTVVDSKGAGVSGTCVHAYPSADHYSPGQAQGNSDSSGHFTIGHLAPGSYHVYFDPCSDRRLAPRYYGGSANAASASIVTVSGNATTSGIDAALGDGASISGTVTSAVDGSPLSGICANLDALSGQDQNQTGYATTDDAGHFTIAGLPGGMNSLRLTPCNGTQDFVARNYLNHPDDEAGDPITVAAGQTLAGIDQALPAAGSVTGHVTYPDGTPAPDACVSLKRGSHDFVEQVQSDGSYRVAGLDAGTYSVYFYGCGSKSISPRWYPNSRTEAGAQLVQVALGTVTGGIDQVLHSGSTISGTVRDQAGQDVVSACVTAMHGGVAVGDTFRIYDGHYRLMGLDAGEYTIRVWDCWNRDAYAESWYGGTDQSSATPVTVQEDGERTGIDIQMTRPGRPHLDGLDATSGSQAGGETVALVGYNLGQATGITFGGIPAQSFEVISDNEVDAVAPASSVGTVDVQLTTPGGTSDTGSGSKFTFVRTQPVITGLSPTEGPLEGGTIVTLHGDWFDGATAVLFGDRPASSFTVQDAHTIQATSPPTGQAGSVDVLVTTPAGQSTARQPDRFVYLRPPWLWGVFPGGGPEAGGTSVELRGSGFTGATSVRFGTAPAAFTVVRDDLIQAISPPGKGSVAITINGARGLGGSNSSNDFFYEPVPVITALSVGASPLAGGTSVTIRGHGFSDAWQVKFGAAGASFKVISDTEISATAPASTSRGTIDVTVVSSHYGPSATGPADRFRYIGSPWASSISPDHGNVQGGTPVTIKGLDLDLVTKVMFGTYAATSFKVNPDGSVTAIAPQHLPNTVYVTLTTPYGSTDHTAATQFRYGLLH